MINIERTEIYKYGEFSYVNYTMLSPQEVLEVLAYRNREDIRKYMFNTYEILESDHLNFVESLKYKENAYYWAIKKGEVTVGYFNVVNINKSEDRCFLGLLFTNEAIKNLSLLLNIVVSVNKFLFDVVGIERIDIEMHKDNKFMLALNMFIGYIQTCKDSHKDTYIKYYINKEMFCNKNIQDLNVVKFARYYKDKQ